MSTASPPSATNSSANAAADQAATADAPTSPAGTLVVTSNEAEERGERLRPIDWDICKRLFFDYMWRYKALQMIIIGYAAILAIINTIIPVLITTTLSWVIDTPSRWQIFSISTLNRAIPPTMTAGVLTGAALCTLAAAAYYLTMRCRIYAVNRLAERVVHDLRCDIFNHVQKLHMGFFDKTKMGWILSRGTSDVNAIRHAVAQVIPRTLLHAIEVVLFVSIMFVMDVWLTVVILTLGPVFWIVNTWFRRRVGDAYRQVQFSMSRITANLAETVAGIRVTQSYAREDLNTTLFRNLCLDHRGSNMRAAGILGVYIGILDLFNQIVVVTIIAFGGWRALTGEVSWPEVLGFLFFTGRLFMAIQVLAEIYNTILLAMAGGERIFKLLDTTPEITDRPDASSLPRTGLGTRIEFQSVTFGYRDDRPVLRELSFTCEPGQAVALVGHTGSGKTTIVSLLGRLYEHQRGRILIDGRDIDTITLGSLHSQMSLVLQENFLFAGTVMENIRFGKPDATDDEVIEACRALDCLDVFEQLPGGLNFNAGERGDSLSLGQRQLACFARAWLADPRLFMLDEATSAVDTHTEHRLQTALERLMTGRTTFVVAHRLSTIRRADLILVLDHGELIERGTHDELLTQAGHYADLYAEFIRLSKGR